MESNITFLRNTSIINCNNQKLLFCIIILQVIALFSGFLTNTQNNIWYDSIVKPSWNPSVYLFDLIWATFYLPMGFSIWLIWKSKAPHYKKMPAISFFLAQLFLNFWWTIIFFTYQSPKLAFFEILIMIFLIFITILKFAKISKTAAWLLVPHIAWVCFTALLNYNIWTLN